MSLEQYSSVWPTKEHYGYRSSRYTSWIDVNPEWLARSHWLGWCENTPVACVIMCRIMFTHTHHMCRIVRISCFALLAENNQFETASCDEPPLRSSTCRRR